MKSRFNGSDEVHILTKQQYYLNATREELDKVPEWLRPRYPSPFSARFPTHPN